MDDVKRGFRTPEAVRYAGRPRSALYEAIKDGDLVSYKVGGRRLFLREDLDAWIDRLIDRAQMEDSKPPAA